MLVLADAGASLGLARLLVGELLVFLDQGEGDGQRDLFGAVECGQEVDALDAGARGVVVVPADQLALVGVRLVGDAVVNNEHGVVILDLSHQGLNDLPQVRGGECALREEASDLVMADARSHQAGEARGRSRAKGRDQVIGIEIKKRLVHCRILPNRLNRLRNIS